MSERGDRPAFPRMPVVRVDGEVVEPSQTGMTVREVAAIHIHAGLLTSWPGVPAAKAAAVTKEHVDALLAALEEP